MKLNINYYRILNISPDAGDREIRQTYLRLARKYHPDKNKGNKLAERKFKQINEAYQALKDPQFRRQFDSKLKQRMDPPRQDTITLPDSFKSTPPKPRKPSASAQDKELPLDLEATLTVSLETICQNRSCVIKYLKPENGKQTKSSFSIRIPRGVQSGDWLLFKNKGGAQGIKVFGDLYVEVQFKTHSLFTVKGWDVYLNYPTPFFTMLLERKTIIPTLYKQDVQLTIPSRISNKTRLRLKGLGLPKKTKKEQGDMFVKIFIDYPSHQKQKIQRKMATLKGNDLKAYLKEQSEKNLHYSKVKEYKKAVKKLYRERKQ